MITSEVNKSTLVKYTLLLFIAIGLAVFSILEIISLSKEFHLKRLLVLIPIAFIINFCFHFGTKAFQRIRINTISKTIESTFTGIFLQLILPENRCQYRIKHFMGDKNRLETILIVDSTGTRISFNSKQYKNYDQLVSAVKEIGHYNEKLDTKILQLSLIYLSAYMVILGFLFLSIKFIGMR